jgi:hypothetical protein
MHTKNRPEHVFRATIAAAIFVALALSLASSAARAGQAASSGPGAPAVSGQSTDDSATLKDFQDRVENYIEIHKEKGVNEKSTASPSKLQEHKQQAAEKVRASRPAAKQGDIFTPPIAGYFKKQLAATLNGPDGGKVRASLRHAEPLPKTPLQVNARYPRNLPLQSMPPTLLLNLPRLPGKLQYRIVGPTLVLFDQATGLVVDLLPDAVPQS